MHSPEHFADTSEAPLEPLTSASAALDARLAFVSESIRLNATQSKFGIEHSVAMHPRVHT